jgi:hypothetical protein
MGGKYMVKGPDVATRGLVALVTVSEEPVVVKPSMSIALKKGSVPQLP